MSAMRLLNPLASQQQASSGVALVTTLVIVVLISVLASTLIDRHQVSIAQTGFFLERSRALEHVLGGEAYARYLLREDFLAVQKEKHPNWQKWSSPLEIEGAVLSLRIQDLQALFNLNSLGDDLAGQQFNRLLDEIEVTQTIASLASDWLDSDQLRRTQGAEDADYLLARSPYRAANTSFRSLSELSLLGKAPLPVEHLNRLYPLVSALPVRQPMKLNINSAHPLVLKSIATELSPAAIGSILGRDTFYTDSEALIEEHPELESVLDSLVFESSFFRADIHLAHDDSRTTLSSMIYRDLNSGRTRVISRDFNLPAWVSEPKGKE